MSLRVLSQGVASSVQDLGRFGFGHLGVTGSGAVDPDTSGRLNLALGNDVSCAVLESAGGLRLVAEAPVAYVRDGDIGPSTVEAGGEIRLDPQPGRMWGYLAVRGGVDAPMVLGSRSADALSGIVPLPVTDGAIIAIGEPGDRPMADVTLPMSPGTEAIRVSVGPRADWLEDGAMERLTSETWTVEESNRVGIRLGGTPISPSGSEQLRSEGLLAGAIQVPGSGLPLVMGRDHPTTGGYPVLAVVLADDLGRMAQLPRGSRLRFVQAPT